MTAIKRIARRLAATRRRGQRVRPEAEHGDPELRQRIDALGAWFHNIDLHGTPTKVRPFGEESLDYPAELWKALQADMPDLRGKSVLDIGCNAGYFSIECKRLGAAHVLGVDINQGTSSDVIAQARFAAGELGLDVEFRLQDFTEMADEMFDVVVFMGVLYHLDDPIAGLRNAARLARETVIVESAVTNRSGARFVYVRQGWKGDATSPWVPTRQVIDELLEEAGFRTTSRPRVPAGRGRYLVVAHR